VALGQLRDLPVSGGCGGATDVGDDEVGIVFKLCEKG
jgi:hypothetical protein